MGHLVVEGVQLLLQPCQNGLLTAHLGTFFQKDPVAVFLFLLQLFPGALDGFHTLDELGEPADPQLPVQGVVLFRFLRFKAQGLYPCLHFAFDVVDAGQVVGGVVQAPCRFLLPHAEPGDAGSFLKNGTAVLGTAVQDLVDLVLADEEHGALAHARIRQKVQNVLQAAVLFVDGVIAVPGPVQPPGDAHFIEIQRQPVVPVVENKGDLRHSKRAPLAGTRKDNIFHFAATEVFGALFAQYPAHRVRDITFSRTVGPYYCRNARTEFQGGAVGKGFEPEG